jgi:hypothetical protein
MAVNPYQIGVATGSTSGGRWLKERFDDVRVKSLQQDEEMVFESLFGVLSDRGTGVVISDNAPIIRVMVPVHNS